MAFGPVPSSPGDAGGNKWFLILGGLALLGYGWRNRGKIPENERGKAVLVVLLCLSLIVIGLYNLIMKR